MLNVEQTRIFNQLSDHLHHQHRHENGLCKCSNLKPFHMFVSGESVRAQAYAIWHLSSGDFVTCAVAAPTGLAAFNVGGVTVHRLFQLPIEHEGKPAVYWSLPKDTRKYLRHTFSHLKLLIVDEISSLYLVYVHLRLTVYTITHINRDTSG